MEEVGYKKLIVWQKADQLARQIYFETKSFPKEEMYGLTSQLRRAAISVPTNIVEGYGRQGRKELKHFVNIALGSLAETSYLIDFCFNVEHLNTINHGKLQSQREEVGRLLWRFYKSL